MYVEPVYHAGGLLRGRLPRDLYHEQYHDEAPPTLFRVKPWRLPKSNVSFIKPLSERLAVEQITRNGFQPDLIISFSPHFIFLKERLRVPFVYYCVDHQSEQQAEAETLAKADLTIAATKVLLRRFAGRARRLEFLPHGVTPPATLGATNGKGKSPIAEVRPPVAGYIGALNSCVSVDLLEALCQAAPDLSLVLIGPYAPNSFGGGMPTHLLDRLRKLPLAHLLGPKPSRELDDYIRTFDVCLVPYDTNHPRVHFSYHKVLQYLACGKPVVTTCFAEEDILPPHVSVANGSQDFTAAVIKTLATHSAELAEECRAFARQHTWSQRVEQLSQWIGAEA